VRKKYKQLGLQMPDKIREGLKNGAEKKVYMRADARARYVDVKQVLIEIRQAGIENVCLLAEKLQP
jgi:biopolymer transport protein ExbD